MRRSRTVITIALLEVYALVLALIQMPGGVRTDEAKYLLNIPYPHPPFLRWIFSSIAFFPAQELVWRVLIATAVVQSVWFLFDLGDVLPKLRRMSLCVAWLLSAAVILQGGTIILAVLAGVAGLVFVWLALHPHPPTRLALIGLLWLAALFSVYQSILFAPLVLAAMVHARATKKQVVSYFVLPMALLALYSFTNPLALVSMVNASGQHVPVVMRLQQIFWIWIIAGSGVVSLYGTIGILSSGRAGLVGSFVFVLGFIMLTSQYYYAILLTPLLLGGLFLLLCKRRVHPTMLVVCQCIMTAVLLVFFHPTDSKTPARSVMRLLADQGMTGAVILDGSFGHEWQYESTSQIIRFNQMLSVDAESEAKAFVCVQQSCDDDVNPEAWKRLPDMPVPVWVRR